MRDEELVVGEGLSPHGNVIVEDYRAVPNLDGKRQLSVAISAIDPEALRKSGLTAEEYHEAFLRVLGL